VVHKVVNVNSMNFSFFATIWFYLSFEH